MKSFCRQSRWVYVGLVVLIALFGMLPVGSAQAVDAGNSYMRCDRMKEGIDPGDCLIVFTSSSTTAVETSIKLTLDSEWVSATHFSATAGNYTVSTTGLPAGVDAMPGITTATNVSGNTIMFPVTDLTNSTDYGFFITGGLLQNPAASATQLHTVFTRTGSDAATADTKTLAVPTIANDQIVITASVAPSFTFVFNNNAQSLGTLTTSNPVSGGGTTVTITTNAPAGWNAWALSANAALNSVAAGNYTIDTTGTINGTPDSLSNGVEGYVLDVDKTDAGGGGTVTVAAEYNGTDTVSGGTLATTYQLIGSANGLAAGDILTLIPRASISGLTPAATDYTDTLTVVGAGVF